MRLQGIAGVYIPEQLFESANSAESIKGVEIRGVIRLRAAAKPVFCLALPLDKNYIDGFNASHKTPIQAADAGSTIVMGAYYRKHLGIGASSTGRTELTIISKDGHWGRLRANAMGFRCLTSCG